MFRFYNDEEQYYHCTSLNLYINRHIFAYVYIIVVAVVAASVNVEYAANNVGLNDTAYVTKKRVFCVGCIHI